MGVRMRGAREKRASGATALLCAGARQHKTSNIFAVLILLIGAIVPLGHQARVKEAAAAEAAQLQILLGVSAEELSASICYHGDGGIPDDEESRLCKEHCALFLALQHHMPAFMPRGLAWPARGRIVVAAPVTYRAALKAGHEPAEQARPRAPPASFDIAIV
jgi:hypothetical protein